MHFFSLRCVLYRLQPIQRKQAVLCIQFLKITPPLFIPIEIRVLLSHDFKQTALNRNKKLVHIGLVGLPAAAEVRVR